jgi:cyclopropane-fatty-acyl-phospholipid synthase
MGTDIFTELQDQGIYPYSSDELNKFEKQLTKYFSREYERYRDSDDQSVVIDQGPLAIESDELADDHYNEGLTFFQNFLDEDTMSYSMAYFDSSADRVMKSVKTLEQAQIDKFALIAKRMKLKGDEKLLNIGCGFGFFEHYLLKTFPELHISSITHSQDQYDFIMKHTKELAEPLSSERLKIYLGKIDRDSVPVLGIEKYDVICSIGMMEHINNVKLFFDIINQLLVKNGRMFHHLIVSRDLIPQLLDSNNTLIGSYFPGGKVLPFAALNTDLAGFTIEESWFVCGLNYWKTLDKWHERYWQNMERLYPHIMDSERVEHWNNYFVLCKAMFFPENGSAYGNGQYLYKKN